MIVQSPLKREHVAPNLRKVPKPDPSARKKHASTIPNAIKREPSRPVFRPGRIILYALIVGIFGFLYLTHVFQTQQLLEEVQLLEQEYNRTRQIHDDVRLQYDRMIGPADIYEKAKKLGFINGGPADDIIRIR